ncbi:MAG: hypothetical protein AB7Q29_04225 [Vicinamibacterales bacterium]
MHRRTFLGTMAALVLTGVNAPQAQKGEERYGALGTGHFIQENRENGRFLVLEDKSVWEIDERNHHMTSQWQQYDAIGVRYQPTAEPPFQYGLTNEDKDQGAAAKWIR